jgi:hypothetical protein
VEASSSLPRGSPCSTYGVKQQSFGIAAMLKVVSMLRLRMKGSLLGRPMSMKD